ncbi:YlbF family regulator [Evansella sp. AB-P1]|uniref:YlbF family regulator n=1 Tax=Evansella sp. AB-P1 TaxID=3037653 RepID=UPI00241CE42A|nr:YlbF family regulator [Evansella sp. AB-P1]MDG5786388.1 YlbF family regulator [Evansella sp. AB-P1]
MANPYDKAHELASVLKESEEFTLLKNLHDQVNSDEVAKRMLDNFRNVQVELQQKQMQGAQITEEEIQQAQKQFELVQQHETISKLMESEQRMSQLITEINKVITEPLEELYGAAPQE